MQEEPKKPIAAAWTGGFYTAHPKPANVTWKGKPDRQPSNGSVEALVPPPIPDANVVALHPPKPDPTQGVRLKTRQLGPRTPSIPRLDFSKIDKKEEEKPWYDCCVPDCCRGRR